MREERGGAMDDRRGREETWGDEERERDGENIERE